jgi:formylglycine-generating enzyme required for sulfatase activity
MGRPNYGSVGGRRSGNAGWQWMMIGLVMGFACSAIVVLGLLTAEVLNLNSDILDEANTPVAATQVSIQPTTTPLPTVDLRATIDAEVNAALSGTMAAQPPTATIGMAQDVALPTITPIPPTTDPSQQVAPTDIPTQTPVTAIDSAGQPGTASEIPAPLQGIVSDLLVVTGGIFNMGTTTTEVANAVYECVNIDQGACAASYAEDSYPQHSVTVDNFRMEVTEVTNEQYIAFLNWMGPNSHRNGCFGQECINTTGEDENSSVTFDQVNYKVSPIVNLLPITSVTWYGARAYCEAIGRRLPTEAEWERAARGQNNYVYPWGNERDLTFALTNRPTGSIGAREVGTYPQGASQYGILDMAGNVAEWVWDYYSAIYYQQAEATGLNPTGPASGTDRVIRGGSWDNPPFFARSVHRMNARPEETSLAVGFRCADDFEEETFTEVDPASLGPAPPAVDLESPHEAIDAAPTVPPIATVAPSGDEASVPPAGNN